MHVEKVRHPDNADAGVMLATAPALFLAEATVADFERHAARHGWRYESADEHARRFRAFRDNARFIDAHNARADVSFRLGMNLWGDRTLDEIGALGRGSESAAAMLQVATSALIAAGERVPTRQRPPLVGKGTDGGKGGGKDAKRARVKIAPNANRDLSSKEDENPEIPPVELYLPSDAPPPPETLDWREKGVTSDVYNQGECGACYAIVTAGAVEAAAAIGSGAALVPLSPQSIVDCSGNVSQARDVIDSGNHGCIGGGIVRRWRSPLPALAGPARCSPRAAACSFNYVLKNGGVVSEEAYPSHLDEAPPANCSFSRADVAGAIGAYVNVSANATLLAYALAQVTRGDRAPHRLPARDARAPPPATCRRRARLPRVRTRWPRRCTRTRDPSCSTNRSDEMPPRSCRDRAGAARAICTPDRPAARRACTCQSAAQPR